MQIRKNKKSTTVVAVVLCLVIIAAGTFAWITSQDKKLNHFETATLGDGTLSLSEIFTPPTDWKPGQEVNKDVTVINSGESTMMVRISLEEIMNKLGNNGVVKTTTAFDSLNYTDSSVLTNPIPVTINITPYSEWNTITDISYNTGVTGILPSGAVVKVLQTGSVGSYSFGAVAYVPVTYDGAEVYQKVNIGDFTMSESVAGSGTFDKIRIDGVVTGSNREVQFPYYDGRVKTEKDWAGDNIFVSPTSITSPPASAFNGNSIYVLSDSGSKMSIIFDNLTDTPTLGKWYYSEKDGYFYYLNKVAPGTATAKLIDALMLDGTAGSDYSGMKFDLGIIADGIQNTSDALHSPTGWDLTNKNDTDLLSFLNDNSTALFN